MSIRIAVLLSGRSGRGSNMQAIAEACADGRIDGRVVLVLGNAAESPALARARELGLRAESLSTRQDGAAYADALRALLHDARIDLICLAGYMRKVPDPVVSAYAGRILNIHAALLPAFGGKGMYGHHAHQAVLDYGVKVSGCTVHFVDGDYDTGPIVLQTPVVVQEDDTEHQAYPRAVALFAAGRLRLEGRRVRVAGE